MIVGDGDFRYELAEGWEQLPDGWEHGDVAGVATDSQDRVYVFNRGEHPVIVYDRDGRFLSSWGEGVFPRPHGITIDSDDTVYCADDTDHTVRVFSTDGTLRQTLGTPNQPSDTGYDMARGNDLRQIVRAAGPFNRPTRLSRGPNGDLYVSDGYGNARVHRFSPSGELIHSWGGPGVGPGEFHLPHSVWAHRDGRVFVCDRENDRVQIFTAEGEYLEAWTNVTRPGDLFIDREDRVYIGEMSWDPGFSRLHGVPWTEARPSRLSVRDLAGEILASWGTEDACAPGSFVSPHGIWVDSHGDLYVGEVTRTALGNVGRIEPDCHSLQKFVRV